MKKSLTIYLLLLILAQTSLFSGGSSENGPLEPNKPMLAVSIVPQQYVVDRIAGDLVETVVLVGPGQNPHSYEPTPRQMAALSQADAWITSNTDFETALISKIASMYPNLLVVDGTQGVTFRTLDAQDHEEEEEASHDGDEHGYEGNLDRHTWLGQEPIKIMARHVTTTLIAIDSGNTATYEQNLGTFITEVDDLFNQLSNNLAQLKGTTVLVYHPSFGYLLDEFGITQMAVETGGKEPTAKNLSTLIAEAKETNVPAIFVQAQFPVSAAQNVANSIGAQVLPLDPLAYDWMENIRKIGATLSNTLLKDGGTQ